MTGVQTCALPICDAGVCRPCQLDDPVDDRRAAASLLSQSLKGFFWISVVIATVSTLCGILLPIVFDLPIPSGAAIILMAGIAFAFAALARGVVPSLKGNIG